MKRLVMTIMLFASPVYADLGVNYPTVSDSVAENQAKTGAAGLGITTIYDHTNQSAAGNYYVPITYNRPGDSAAGEQDVNSAANTTDIDYVPLSQLKGLNGSNGTNGSNGAVGAAGTNGAAGAKGLTGDKGAQGPQGIQGPKGDSANVPAIDPRLDVEIREYDAKHWSVSSFASFGMQSDTPRYIVGQKLTLKLGSSYEERHMAVLEKKLMTLEDAYNVLEVLK